ncbi:MAG: hypothetical protein HXS44_06290 [Theionarchaea archaeon]|nr:hypothetical protein [Theionarchaea archaeon]
MRDVSIFLLTTGVLNRIFFVIEELYYDFYWLQIACESSASLTYQNRDEVPEFLGEDEISNYGHSGQYSPAPFSSLWVEGYP